MKTLEFEAEVTEHEMLKLPGEIARQFSVGDRVRVLLLADAELIADMKEEDEWRQLAAQQFFSGYDEADSAYDQL